MMEIGTFKTLIKASMNISNDHKVPVYQTIEKNKVNYCYHILFKNQTFNFKKIIRNMKRDCMRKQNMPLLNIKQLMMRPNHLNQVMTWL